MKTKISIKRATLWTIATMVGPLLLYAITSGVYIGFWYAHTRYQGSPTPYILIKSMFIGYPPAIWAVVALWWWVHRKQAGFRNLFLAKSNAIVPDIGIGVILGILWVAAFGLLDIVSWQAMLEVDSAKLFSIPASLSAGFGEEFLCRGFLFWLLAAAGAGKGLRLVLASIVFGLMHYFWGPEAMIGTTILGFTFGLITLWRGNVWPAVVAHVLLNLCIEPGLFKKAFAGGFNA